MFANDHNANVGRRFSFAVAYPEPKDNRVTLRQGLKRPPVTRGEDPVGSSDPRRVAERYAEMSPATLGSLPGNGLVVDPAKAAGHVLVHTRSAKNAVKDSA